MHRSLRPWISSSSSCSLRVGCLVGEVLDGLAPPVVLIGDAALPPVLFADEDLIGELDFKGEEAPLEADAALGGVIGLGEGWAGLKNSANSL